MQYTLRNVSPELDRALRQRAREQGKSLNTVALEALMMGTGAHGTLVPRRDLEDIAGTWIDDPEVDAALADQRRIDPELWS